jgi:hypothetical protein
VTVTYSKGRCKDVPRAKSLYDVPKDTVWQLIISPKKTFPLSELLVRHPEKFDRGGDPTFADVFHYVNSDSSVGIQTKIVSGIEDVSFFTYTPGRDSKKRCSNLKPKS